MFVVTIFFDKYKVCELKWRHGILLDINETGIEGRMFKFVQNFLKPRSYKVKVTEILSDTRVQTEGTPQESVASPTFLIQKINKIVAQLSNDSRDQITLFMEDLEISYRHPNWRVVERKPPDSINIVEKLAQKNGFKFSTSKTSMLHSTKLSIPPQI